MVMDTQTQRAQCWLDDLGSQVRNSFDSFVVRAPKIALLSTKTASNNTISVAGSSMAIFFKKSAPSSCSTAQDQLTNDNKHQLTNDNKHRPRRIHSLHPLPPISEEEESDRIAVRAAVLALRLAVNCVDQLQNGESTQGSSGQRLSRDSRKLRESKLRRHQEVVFVAAANVVQAQRRSSVSSAENEQRLWRSLSRSRRSSM